MNSDLIRDPRS